ncbi:MAG: hypothetical protein OEY41_13305 [Acidimicrobiia bacterium]|nr:hypothetical protein [Acidimicrobiia bacterium]
MTIEDLRQGLDQIDLDDALMGHDVEPEDITSALALGSVDEAKAAIIDVLRVMRSASLGGFPLGPETDLVDLVGFTDDM